MDEWSHAASSSPSKEARATGKSTQARLLKSSLEERGKRVVLTREPGGSPGAEQIRKLLVEGEPQRWTPLSETLLFLAARADHVARIIEPSLASGMWVVSDRFSDSTYVYQGIARGLGAEKVRRLQEAALGSFAPDLTIVLDLDPAEGLKRAGGRAHGDENRFERFDGEFHEKLRAAFRDIARARTQALRRHRRRPRARNRSRPMSGARSRND